MSISLYLRFGVAIALACELGGCHANNLPAPDAHFATNFDTQPPLQPAPLPDDLSTRSVMLKSIGIPALTSGTIIGGTGTGKDCKLAGTRRILANSNVIKPTVGWARAFYKVLNNLNFRVMGNPDNGFEDRNQLHPDLLLSLSVVDQKSNICYTSAMQPAMPHTIEEEDRIKWEVFDVAQNKVVLTFLTYGYAKSDLTSDPTDSVAWQKVLEDNVTMLAGNQQFRELVEQPVSPRGRNSAKNL